MPHFQVLSETRLQELHIGGLNQSYSNLFGNRINDQNEHKESELLIQAFNKIKIILWSCSKLWLNDRNLLWYFYLDIYLLPFSPKCMTLWIAIFWAYVESFSGILLIMYQSRKAGNITQVKGELYSSMIWNQQRVLEVNKQYNSSHNSRSNHHVTEHTHVPRRPCWLWVGQLASRKT